MFEIEVERDKFSVFTDIMSSSYDTPTTFDIVPQGDSKLGSGGMYVEQMTKMQTYAIKLGISQSEDFVRKFDVDGDTTLGISWDRVNDVVSGLKDVDVITITYDSDVGKLKLDIPDGEITIACVSLNSVPNTDLPDLDYNVSFETTLEEIHGKVDFVSIVDNDVFFTQENGEMKVWASGDTDDIERGLDVESLQGKDGLSTKFDAGHYTNVLNQFPNSEVSDVTVEMVYNGGADEKNMPQQVSGNIFDESPFSVIFAPRN